MWSLGCILAELLGREVLFKGTDYIDQLHKIVGILGLPKDTSFWDSSSTVTEYIRNLRDESGRPPPEEPIDFTLLYPHASPEAIHLLQNLVSLNPSARYTAWQALEHPFVATLRDQTEEMECPSKFDFESFESIESDHVLRQCIVEEVMKSKGLKDYKWARPSRRYTGSSLSTPSSAVNLNAIHAVQGKDVEMTTQPQFMVMSDQFVGEPEDMDEDDIMAISDQLRRTMMSPDNADLRSIERQLSKDW